MIAAGVAANISKNSLQQRRRRVRRPAPSPRAIRPPARAACQRLLPAAGYARRRRRGRRGRDPASHTSRPLNRCTSVPAASGRCRSASCVVAVRRGSSATIFMRGRRSRAASQPLQQDRMAPRGVGADQHHEIGRVEVFVTHRAPRLRRRRACGRPRPRPCTVANWYRYWRRRCSPS